MRFKKLMAVALTAAMTVGLFSAAKFSSPMSANAASFSDLSQNDIVSAMGAGWNLGNQLEACIGGVPYETAWGNPTISEGLIKAVKAAGFSTIRVPVSYLNKIGSDYTIDSSWLNRVKEVVDMCINNDLYVIINMHGDGYNSVDGGWLLCNGSDQTTIRAKYKACWQQIANKFKDYDEHLIFESMNEEFDGTYGTPNTTYYSNINALNQIFVDTVRQTGGNNAMRWLMVPGWNTNIEYTAGNYGFVVPSDNYRSSSIPSSEKRIMISVHYYDPWGFCGEESSTYTQWGSTATDSSKVCTYGYESFIQSEFGKMYNTFVSKGYPVVIGEYGAIDKSAYDSKNLACREEYAKKVCTYAKQYGCVPVWWDNGYNGTYGFGLFDRNTYAVTQQSIINAIIGVMGTGSSSSGGSSSGGSSSGGSSSSTSGTVIFSNGSSDVSYSTSDASWLTKASDSATITLKYTCTDSSHGYWGVLGWGASVNGNWVNGNSYSAAATATDTVTVTFTAGELKSSLGITSSSSVDYLALSAYNGGKIISLSIADSGSSSGDSSSGSSDSGNTGSGDSSSSGTGSTGGSTDSGSTSTTTTLELNANKLTKGTYTSNYTYGDFTIGASSSKYISVESTSATINGTSYTQRIKMNGAANSTGRYIKFTTTGAASVDIIGISTSSGATRVIRLAKDSVGGTTVGDITVTNTPGVQTINVTSAGTYYLYSTNSGIYVYDVKVTTTSSSSSSNSSSNSSSSSSSGTLDGTYYIKSSYSGKYLDVADGSSANSANIQQYSYNGSAGQKFKLVSAGDGYYYIYTGASSYSKVIDVAGKSTADGANICQYSYNGNSNQKFKLTEVSSGVYAILTGVTNGASCLDVYNWSTEDGGNIAQWSYWGGACQLWILEKAN